MTTPDTLVVRWAHHDYDQPTPLVMRHVVQVGDIVDSSHYGKVKVIEVQRTDRDYPSDTVGFVFSRVDGSLPIYGTWGERYPGTGLVPRFEKAEEV